MVSSRNGCNYLYLGGALIFELVVGCWALISPWLEKDTAEKVKFINGIEKLREHIPDDAIPESMGGSSSFEYVPPAI